MSDENREVERRPTFGQRINEFMGDKPHGWYFFYGVGISVAVMWAAYVFLISPAINHTYSRIYIQQDQTIRELQGSVSSLNSEIAALRNTVVKLQSFGQPLERQELRQLGGTTSFVGGQIEASVASYDERYIRLKLYIDTCGRVGYENCESFRRYLIIAIGGYVPLYLGNEIYTFTCERATDSSMWINVYRQTRQ